MEKEELHPLTDDVKDWYAELFPDKLVRAHALNNYANLSWRKLEGKMRGKVKGISKAKQGGRKALVALYTLDETQATGMVAACDALEGFDKPSVFDKIRKRSLVEPNVSGIACDLYINGKKIGNADSVSVASATVTTYNPRVVFGTNREEKTIKTIELSNGKTVKLPTPITTSYFWSTARASQAKNEIGAGKTSLEGEGALTIDFKIKNKNVALSVEEVPIVSEEYRTEMPCRKTDDEGNVTGYECVNWLRFATKDESKKMSLIL